ncbi:MAG: hypothetical protein AAGB22_13045, partial [Bacteroidota bacterium]
IEVGSKKHYQLFIDFPHDLYKDDLNYVPELFIAQRDMLDTAKNPFFLHSKAQLFLAVRNRHVVGRIAAIRNNNHNAYTDSNVGFFGFFDVVEDYEVAKALLDKVMAWQKEENLNAVIGPANFSTNDPCGMLVEGYDSPPVMMMTYNKPYYNDFVQRYGFTKRMDLLAYQIREENVDMKPIRLMKGLESRLEQRGITIRTIRKKDFKAEVQRVKTIYNKAWEKNWGFVPVTDEEFDHAAKDLKMVVNPNLTFIAEHNGEPIGFSLSLPDMNQVFRRINRGRLLPTGLLKLLYYKSKIDGIRIITLGVVEGYRRLGIEGCFYARTIDYCVNHGIHKAEASWILEDNEMMNKGIQKVNGEVYKRYRLYEMPVA